MREQRVQRQVFTPNTSMIQKMSLNSDFPSADSNEAEGSKSIYQPERVVATLEAFLDDFDYSPTGINPVNQELEDYMHKIMITRGLECSLLKRILHLMAALVQLPHPTLPMDVKKNAALYLWFCMYIDEMIFVDPVPFKEFGQRLLTGQPQLDPVLTVYAEVLNKMWQFYDPLIASLIMNGTLQFVSYTCLEQQLEKRRFIQGEDRFAWYLRDATGIFSYGLLGFTKQDGFSAIDLIQAVPNFSFWFSATNDLLSFHKEESQGETGTYIWTRAKIENKSRYEICDDLLGELKVSRQIMYKAMENISEKAVNIWKNFERGFVEWHLTLPRYRLKELGFH